MTILRNTAWAVITMLCLLAPAVSAKIVVSVYRASDDPGIAKQTLGTVVFKHTDHGLLIMPHLRGLTPGLHGFHVHVNPSCEKAGKAAGGHFDPKKTGKHLGPYNANGHLGDLPVLYVNQQGVANVPTLAPRLRVEDLAHHSIIIHAHGDNYSDIPTPLGGGGARVACGVFPSTLGSPMHHANTEGKNH